MYTNPKISEESPHPTATNIIKNPNVPTHTTCSFEAGYVSRSILSPSTSPEVQAKTSAVCCPHRRMPYVMSEHHHRRHIYHFLRLCACCAFLNEQKEKPATAVQSSAVCLVPAHHLSAGPRYPHRPRRPSHDTYIFSSVYRTKNLPGVKARAVYCPVALEKEMKSKISQVFPNHQSMLLSSSVGISRQALITFHPPPSKNSQRRAFLRSFMLYTGICHFDRSWMEDQTHQSLLRTSP